MTTFSINVDLSKSERALDVAAALHYFADRLMAECDTLPAQDFLTEEAENGIPVTVVGHLTAAE